MIDLSHIFDNDKVKVSMTVDIPDDLFGTEEMVARMPETVADMIREARAFWEAEAGRRLDSSRDEYQRAIRIRQVGGAWVLDLDSEVANMLETGVDPFDMKPGMLNGPKAKVGPTGRRYNRIPVKSLGSPVSIRTVSDASAAGSWVHPGLKGANIADEVEKELSDRIIPDFIEKLIDEVLQ